VIIMASKKTRPSLSARASFFRHLESVIAADIDRAVGAPLPAAVVTDEMAVAVMMTMPKKAMAMPVASTMPTMPTMPTVTAMPAMASRESLARDGQRSRGQRQGSDCGRSDLLDLRHGRLLRWGRSEDRSAMIPPLAAPAAMRCDPDHPTGEIAPIGMTREAGIFLMRGAIIC
jgi:hypothetical protein